MSADPSAGAVAVALLGLAAVLLGIFLGREWVQRRSDKARQKAMETDKVIVLETRKQPDESLREALRRDRAE